jgi:hypothetical protein
MRGLPLAVGMTSQLFVDIQLRHGYTPWLAAISILAGPVYGYLNGLVTWNETESAYRAALQAAQNQVKMKWPGLPWSWYGGIAVVNAALGVLNLVVGSLWLAGAFSCWALGALFPMALALRRQRVSIRPKQDRYPDIEDDWL